MPSTSCITRSVSTASKVSSPMRSSAGAARVGHAAAVAVDLQAVGQRLGVASSSSTISTRPETGSARRRSRELLRAARRARGRARPPPRRRAAGRRAISTTGGRKIENDVPRPGSETTWIVPPCSSTMRRAVESPRPVPPFLSDQYSSKQCASCSALMPTPVSVIESSTQLPSRAHAHDELAAARHRLARVDQQVEHGLLEGALVEHHQRQADRQVDVVADALAPRPRARRTRAARAPAPPGRWASG